MERDRSQYYAKAIGNALLVLAAFLTLIGIYVLWELGSEVDSRFGFGEGDPGFDDYVLMLWPYSMALVTAVAIPAVGGFYFRWLAVEQDAKMAEFDMLLDALGVPVEDEAGDQPEETRPDA